MTLLTVSLAAFLASANAAEVDADVADALRLLAEDPPIADVQRAALDHFAVSSDELSGMRTAARLKALLPVISGTFAQQDGKTLGAGWELQFAQFSYPDNPYTRNDSNNTGRTVSANATWSLGALVFDAAQLDTYGLVSIHESVLTEVTRLYYTRQHNVLALALDPPKDPRTRAALMLRTREIEAMLDALTGGGWTRLHKGTK
jgi:hypothetical protein